MDEDLIFILNEIANFSPCVLYITLGLSLFYIKKLDKLYKSLLVYVAILIVSDLMVHFFIWKSGNNMMALYTYSFAELAFMLYFYKKYMFSKKQRFIITLGIIGLIYIVIEALLIFVFKGLVIKQFQPYAKVVDNFIIILMALAYLHERMNQFREKEWGSFRLNIVFLVFFTLNALFFLPFNFMVNASNIIFYFWTGHIILLILFYLYLSFEIINNGLSNKIKRTKPNI